MTIKSLISQNGCVQENRRRHRQYVILRVARLELSDNDWHRHSCDIILLQLCERMLIVKLIFKYVFFFQNLQNQLMTNIQIDILEVTVI